MLFKKLGLLAAAGVALSGCVSSSTAATVNGTAISTASLLSEVKAITSNQGFVKQLASSQQVKGVGNNTYSMTFVDEVLNRRISMDLLYQKAQSLHIKLSSQDIALGRIDAEQTFGGAPIFDKFPKSYQAQLIKDSAILDIVEGRLANVNVSIGALTKYYDANPAQFATVCASQILVATQAQANTIYQQLSRGANFAALAKADSGDTRTAPNGGAVGCGTYSNYVTSLGSQFANVVEKLATDVPAPPTHLSTGWSIIEVTSRTSPPFDQLTPQIRAAILGTKGQAAISAYLSAAAKTANISVSPRFGQVVVNSSGLGVSPLSSPTPTKLNFFTPTAG